MTASVYNLFALELESKMNASLYVQCFIVNPRHQIFSYGLRPLEDTIYGTSRLVLPEINGLPSGKQPEHRDAIMYFSTGSKDNHYSWASCPAG